MKLFTEKNVAVYSASLIVCSYILASYWALFCVEWQRCRVGRPACSRLPSVHLT